MLSEQEVLRQENAALRAQLAQLLAADAAKSAQNSALVAQLAKLNDRVEELLALAQRKQRKPAAVSEKKPEPPPVVGADAQKAFDERPAPPTLPKKADKVKREPKRTGRNAVPAHLEVDDHLLRPAACERCGGTALDVVDEVLEEKLHVVKEHQRRRVVRRVTCRCRACLALHVANGHKLEMHYSFMTAEELRAATRKARFAREKAAAAPAAGGAGKRKGGGSAKAAKKPRRG